MLCHATSCHANYAVLQHAVGLAWLTTACVRMLTPDAQDGYITAYSQAQQEPGFVRDANLDTQWWLRHVNRLPKGSSMALLKRTVSDANAARRRPQGDHALADRSTGWVAWRSDPSTWLDRGRGFGQGGDPLLAVRATRLVTATVLPTAAPDDKARVRGAVGPG